MVHKYTYITYLQLMYFIYHKYINRRKSWQRKRTLRDDLHALSSRLSSLSLHFLAYINNNVNF